MEDLKKVRKKIFSSTSKCIKEFNMIQEGDHIMVCISGGKDSYTMLDMFIHFQKYGDIPFEISVVNMDQKQPGFPEKILPEYLNKLGVRFHITEKDTYSIVMDKIPEGKTMCSLCSRLRRGTLYDKARELGCNKLALGHLSEDIIETFFLHLFFSGKLVSMPPQFKIVAVVLVVIRHVSIFKEYVL